MSDFVSVFLRSNSQGQKTGHKIGHKIRQPQHHYRTSLSGTINGHGHPEQRPPTGVRGRGRVESEEPAALQNKRHPQAMNQIPPRQTVNQIPPSPRCFRRPRWPLKGPQTVNRIPTTCLIHPCGGEPNWGGGYLVHCLGSFKRLQNWSARRTFLATWCAGRAPAI